VTKSARERPLLVILNRLYAKENHRLRGLTRINTARQSLQPNGAFQRLPIAIVVLVLELYLAWAYRKAYYPMLAMRVTPD